MTRYIVRHISEYGTWLWKFRSQIKIWQLYAPCPHSKTRTTSPQANNQRVLSLVLKDQSLDLATLPLLAVGLMDFRVAYPFLISIFTNEKLAVRQDKPILISKFF